MSMPSFYLCLSHTQMYLRTSEFKSQSALANSARHVGIIYVKDTKHDRAAAAIALLGDKNPDRLCVEMQ